MLRAAPSPVLWWLAAVATVGLVLASAKAHGRQIRLEREQQGFFHVDFRRENPPGVEAIWRTDRRVFWPTFAVGAVFAVLWAFQAIEAADLGSAGFLLVWAFAASFVVAGLLSWSRLSYRARLDMPPPSRRATWGSVAWWLLVAVAAALVAVSFQV